MWDWLSTANDLLLSFATSFEGTPWLFVFLWLFIALDGLVPIFPSESLVIGVIALSISVGHPNIWLVFAVAIAGAITGDLVAYTIGRALGKRHFKILDRPKISKIVAWAERTIARRPAPVIISARYIPVGRVVVNFTAGRMAFPSRAFALLAVAAAITWSGYSSLIGLGAGHWLEGHALLSVVVGVSGGVLMGLLVDFIVKKILDFGDKRGHEFSKSMTQLGEVTRHTTAAKELESAESESESESDSESESESESESDSESESGV